MESGERFYQNRACQYFPCHNGIREDEFNCIFCYCPLYALGRACGGDWRYRDNGVKDCSACGFPHRPENYSRVLARYPDIMAVAARSDREGLPEATAGRGSVAASELRAGIDGASEPRVGIDGASEPRAGIEQEGLRHED